MPFEWINEWRAHIDKHVCMASNITATRSLLPALQISNCHNHIDDPDYKPVLFVFLLKNYNGFSGWRLTNSNYTAYPQEQEFLFREGFGIIVLHVDDSVLI